MKLPPCLLISLALLLGTSRATWAAPPSALPTAIYTDPSPDAIHPARAEVLHIPSGGVSINGLAYLAAGPGPHPTVVLCHGLPGNEKNLDLAQAIRRAGWNVITFNYRGSWGSPGAFRFAQNPDDAEAVLTYLRVPDRAAALGVDLRRVVIMGHSMGGWVAVTTAAHHPELAGLVTFSPADMARAAGAPQALRVELMAGNMESLTGVTAESMAAEIVTGAGPLPFSNAGKGLVNMPWLALTSDDGLAPDTDALVKSVRAAGGAKIETGHEPTDHGWNDHRIALEARIIIWLQALK